MPIEIGKKFTFYVQLKRVDTVHVFIVRCDLNVRSNSIIVYSPGLDPIK